MKTLGIDTSSKYLGLAIVEDGRLLSEYSIDTGMRHVALLIPLMERILKDLGLNLNQIDGFSISLGPGSFTGLRIGLATVKGLALATNKPVVGIPTLDVIAYNLIGYSSQICPVVDAKRNQVYWAVYKMGPDGLENRTGYALSPIDSLLKKIRTRTIFTGDGISVLGKNIIKYTKKPVSLAPEEFWYPRPSIVAKLGEEKIKAGQQDNIDVLEPMYLYPRECSIRHKR